MAIPAAPITDNLFFIRAFPEGWRWVTPVGHAALFASRPVKYGTPPIRYFALSDSRPLIGCAHLEILNKHVTYQHPQKHRARTDHREIPGTQGEGDTQYGRCVVAKVHRKNQQSVQAERCE